MPYQLSTSLHMFSKWLKSAAVILEVVVTLGFPLTFSIKTLLSPSFPPRRIESCRWLNVRPEPAILSPMPLEITLETIRGCRLCMLTALFKQVDVDAII